MNTAENIELVSTLDKVFLDVGKNKEHQIEINKILAAHKIPEGTLEENIINPERVNNLEKEELILLMLALYEVTNDEQIKPNLYYNSKEIAKAKRYQREQQEELSFPYTFKNYVLSSSSQDYITTMSYQELKALWDSKLLQYNYDIQRKPREKVNRDGSISKKAKTSEKSISEIVDLMRQGKFRSNTIVFNLLVNGEDLLSYEEGELTVTGELNIIDGYHRLCAILNILEENPNHKGFMDVSIKHLPAEEAKHYLGQINKMTKFDKTFVESLMKVKISDEITDKLNKDSKSPLKDRITVNTTVSKKSPYLTNFSILSNAIDDIFAPKNGLDRINTTETLMNFFDVLINYYENDFSRDLKTLIQSRELRLLNYHNTFVGHIVIAKKLSEKYSDIPSKEVIRIIDSIDFSKESEYGGIIITSGKVNSNQVKRQIKKYFEDKVDKLLEG